LLLVERALVQRRLATENILLREELAQRRGAPQIVGDDPKLKHVSLALHRAAVTDTTVLIEGESGTGKELFARALHAKILRALEEKRFDRVGGTAPIQVDVRVVAAMNRNLKAAVAARQYRED